MNQFYAQFWFLSYSDRSYDPSGFENQGHLWILVEDPDNKDRWLAVDSYYGVVTDKSYYKAPYSFPDIKYLDSLNPKWRYA